MLMKRQTSDQQSHLQERKIIQMNYAITECFN